jgi:hypothetical protein
VIVVSGNWLISDGSLVPAPPRREVEPLFRELKRLACLAGVGADGSYRPIERIDVVLAGDTFDGITSRRWMGRVRPWHAGAARREFAEEILRAAFRCGRGPLSRLGRLARHGIRVPAADRKRRPVLGQHVLVRVGVTILPGDRDGVLERPLVVAASRYGFGVGSCWERLDADGGSVSILHGHEFDPLCGTDVDEPPAGIEREPARFGRRPSVSESLAVDLLAVFAARLADTPCPPVVAGRVVRDVAFGPWTAAPAILAGHLVDTSLPADTTSILADTWRRSIDHWHDASTADPPSVSTGFDTVGTLASWMERIEPTGHHGGCPAVCGPCADGWLDTRREDLLASAPRKGIVVLGHPPRRLSGGPIVTLGPTPERDLAEAGTVLDSLAFDRRPVVEIHAARPADAGPAWVAIPRPDGNGGIVSSNDWTPAAA